DAMAIGKPSERPAVPGVEHPGPQQAHEKRPDEPIDQPPHVETPTEGEHVRSPGMGHPVGGCEVDDLLVSVCVVPTDAPESDGTLSWDSTTIVVVEARAGGERGLGCTYGSGACATLIEE